MWNFLTALHVLNGSALHRDTTARNHSNSNRYKETFYFNSGSQMRAHAREAFDLNDVTWPYPSGSWNSYIDYCRSSSGQNKDAGYRYKFGVLNWLNYLLQNKEAYNETPDLWQTSEFPITAVKNAVTLFLAYLQEVDTNDKLGLSVYNSPNGDALLEEQLTFNFAHLEDVSRQRQAGHYSSMTNIGAGLRVAIDELEGNARVGSSKLIVLMTDGVANRPDNTTYARSYAISQAQRAASLGIQWLRLAGCRSRYELASRKSQTLRIAFHFNVPGGTSVHDYEDDLRDAFHQIAKDRPLKLVR